MYQETVTGMVFTVVSLSHLSIGLFADNLELGHSIFFRTPPPMEDTGIPGKIVEKGKNIRN